MTVYIISECLNHFSETVWKGQCCKETYAIMPNLYVKAMTFIRIFRWSFPFLLSHSVPTFLELNCAPLIYVTMSDFINY